MVLVPLASVVCLLWVRWTQGLLQASWLEGLVLSYWWVKLGLVPLGVRAMSSGVFRGGYELSMTLDKLSPFSSVYAGLYPLDRRCA